MAKIHTKEDIVKVAFKAGKVRGAKEAAMIANKIIHPAYDILPETYNEEIKDWEEYTKKL